MASGTRAPSTIVTVSLNGQTDFNIPFEYLARKFVVVTLLGIDRQVLTLNTDYRFVSKTTISLANPTPAGYTQLELRRETSATERLVDFHDGSILRAYDLNLSQIQTLHVAEEARDLTADTIGVNDEGNLDARNRRIVNLADAVNGRDAINLGQVITWNESAYNSMIAAQNAAVTAEAANSQAQSAKDTSIVYANEAARHATASQSHATYSENKAIVSQQAATLSQEAAARSEAAKDSIVASEAFCTKEADRAHTEANRAETEANKLSNMNEFAGTLHSIVADEVRFNRGLRSTGLMRSYEPVGSGRKAAISLYQEGVIEAGLSVDEHGTVMIGTGNQQANTSLLTYWNTSTGWMINNMNTQFAKTLDVQGALTSTGVMEAKSAIRSTAQLVAGYGSNSRVEAGSWGESTAGNWGCNTKWFWYNGGLELGTVRGTGYDSVALMRHTDGASGASLDLWFDPQQSQWRFTHANGHSLTIPTDGNIWMRWAGRNIADVLTDKRVARRYSHTHLGAIAVQNDFMITFGLDVRGLEGFFVYDNIRVQFQFPNGDCRFQINRGGDHQVFELAHNGTALVRRYGWGEGGSNYDFFVEAH